MKSKERFPKPIGKNRIRTGEEFKAAVEKLKIESFEIRTCNVCGDKISWLFEDGKIHMDYMCSCFTGSRTIPRTGWGELAKFHNRYINNLEEMERYKIFKFND